MGSFVAQCIRSRWSAWLGLAVVALSLGLPPNGFGIPMCQFHATTHLPCFACGLTRSFIALAHLRFGQAAFMHPLGFALFPLAVGLAALAPMSEERRQVIALGAEKRGVLLGWIGALLLAVFIVYGLGRIYWVIASGRPSPW